MKQLVRWHPIVSFTLGPTGQLGKEVSLQKIVGAVGLPQQIKIAPILPGLRFKFGMLAERGVAAPLVALGNRGFGALRGAKMILQDHVINHPCLSHSSVVSSP